MRYWAIVVLWLIGFATMMALRAELSSLAARTVMGMVAFSFGGIGLSLLIKRAKSRTNRKRRDQP
jgi:hypothetical protein